MMIHWQPGITLEDIEKQTILLAYAHFQRNKTKTAESLDISIRNLDAKIAKYEGKEIFPEQTIEYKKKKY